jgi:hypothetical protein
VARKLVVEIIGDASSLERTYKSAAVGTQRFGQSIEKATRGALVGSGAFRSLGRSVAFASSAFLGGVGFVAVIKSSVEAASNLEEQLGKSDIVFGSSAKAVEGWSTTLVNSFGLAEEQALQTASSFGALLRPLGITGKEAARQSEQLTQLGSDLAAFYNTDVQSALDALQSGLTGQVRPLRAYGVMLSATRVNQEALLETGKKHASQLTDQEKVIARLAIIYKDTSQAQGNFGLTSKDLAQQEKILHANVRELQTALGVALVPAITHVVTKLNDWLGKSDNQKRVQDDLREAVNKTIGVIQRVSGVIQDVVGKLGGWHQALIILGGAFLGFKAVGIGSAVAVSTANVIAAGITEKAWQAALISTGWGIFAVAAGVAATETIAHWEKVKYWFSEFWLWLQTTADKTFLAIVEPFSHLPSKLGQWARDLKKQVGADVGYLADQAARVADEFNRAQAAVGKAKSATPAIPATPTTPGPPTAPTPTTTAAAGGPRGVTVSQRNTWFDNMINRALGGVQDITGLKAQIARLREIAGLIQQRLAATKDVTRRLNLEDQLLSVQRTIRGDQAQITQNQKDAAKAAADRRAQSQQALFDRLQFNVDKTGLTDTLQDDLKALQVFEGVLKKIIATQGSTLALQQTLLGIETNIKTVQGQITDNRKQAAQAAKDAAKQRAADAKQAADDAKQRAKDAAAAALAARNAIQFRLLGLGPTGGALVPGLENLRKRSQTIRDAVKGTFLDTPKTGSELDHIAKILAGKFGKVSEGVRSAIDQMYKDIRDKLKSHQGDQTKFRHMSSTAFVDSLGLNLTGAQRRAIEARFSTVGRGYTAPGGTSHQFTGGVTITGDVHVHGVQDIAGFENQIVKRAKARPHTRRGA